MGVYVSVYTGIIRALAQQLDAVFGQTCANIPKTHVIVPCLCESTCAGVFCVPDLGRNITDLATVYTSQNLKIKYGRKPIKKRKYCHYLHNLVLLAARLQMVGTQLYWCGSGAAGGTECC